MKAKILAACAVALMVLPLSAAAAAGGDATALAKAGKAPTLAKAGSDALSPEAYIEYASVNDINIHELFFSSVLYEGTESCLLCHQETAEAMLGMGHFKWQGKVENIVGMEGRELGKNQLLNNFCIAVPTNEPRCTQCHTGYGYADKNYNFERGPERGRAQHRRGRHADAQGLHQLPCQGRWRRQRQARRPVDGPGCNHARVRRAHGRRRRQPGVRGLPQCQPRPEDGCGQPRPN